MKNKLQELLKKTLNQLAIDENWQIPSDILSIERTRDPQFGAFTSHVAMGLAKSVGRPSRELAEKIKTHFPKHVDIIKIEVAGPGFLNFYLSEQVHQEIIKTILSEKKDYGRSKNAMINNSSTKIHLEFVSANPTGPLHVGHGRGAVFGDVLGNLLKAVGHDVHKEYYLNDVGRQMQILALSIWLRYLMLYDEPISLPKKAYQGDYLFDIAQNLKDDHHEKFRISASELTVENTEDPEHVLNHLIATAQQTLGDENFQLILDTGLHVIRQGIEDDLKDFGITFDEWFSERSLVDQGDIEQSIEALRAYTYKKDGALWFRATDFGDDKDRVLIRDNGQITYFASDVAYHHNKFLREFNQLIDVMGSDHHGYITRLKAVIQALGHSVKDCTVKLVQFAILYRGRERVQMSTRSGLFVTLKALYDEIGKDAARFFYIMRKCEQHLDLDLELAKLKTNENPVYHIQYAHARICSVFRQLPEKMINFMPNEALAHLGQLNTAHEKALLTTLARYPELIQNAAGKQEPHLLTQYLRDLAHEFHSYYNAYKILVDDPALRDARLLLMKATQQVLINALGILGIRAPESM